MNVSQLSKKWMSKVIIDAGSKMTIYDNFVMQFQVSLHLSQTTFPEQDSCI